MLAKQLKIFVLFVFISLSVVGCVVTENADGTKSYSVSSNFLEKAEQTGESAAGILSVLAPLLGPAGGIAAGALATGLTVLKKMRPKLEQSQRDYELSNTVAAISVEALEQIKKDHPQIWQQMANKLEEEVKNSGIDTKIINNAIRGLRGLPPKA